ncbi:MAG: hypothetical protein PHP26_06250 [Syntrophomonas sp.]|nr:hypothetical protein [Syntrophomonas sp.]MDD2510472.1 hypothetical protein [Syntrophomonas sp.]MDD3879574.1 hypothetical protein [Syntrophomonas sp.]MDD4627017.1 hypothetical protein [Syntrophomonas sp.]
MKIIERIISITLVVAGVCMGIGTNIPVLAADSSSGYSARTSSSV